MTEEEWQQKIYPRLDLLFRRMKQCNDILMDADNDMGKFINMTIAEKHAIVRKAYYFYVSSFGLSYIKNLYLQNATSPGNLMNIRCLIEGIAMSSYIEKLSDDEVELFRMQPFVLEYQIYKKYKELHGSLLDFTKTTESYKKAKQHYKDIEKFNSEKTNRRMGQKIPFIKKRLNYEDVVRDVFGEQFVWFYKMLGMFMHPHDFRTQTKIKVEESISNIQDLFHELILIPLENMFNDFGYPDIAGLDGEYNLLFYDGTFQQLALNKTNELKEMLNKATGALLRNGYSCLGSWLYHIHLFNLDFVLDNSFGYIEQGIIKWKQIVEYFAVLDLFSEDDYYLQDNQLLYYHSQIALARGRGEGDIDPKWYDDAYAEYVIKYPSGVSKEGFMKAFDSSLGFLIDEQGVVPPSLTKLVRSFIDKYTAEAGNATFKVLELANSKVFDMPMNPTKAKTMMDNGELREKEISLGVFLKMCYEESQIMSHATGYMHFANTGAWASGQILGLYIHKFAERAVDKFLTHFQALRDSGKLKEKTLINVLRNYKKRSKEHIELIEKIYRIPKIKKVF